MRRLWQTLAVLLLTSVTPTLAADLRLALAVEPDSIDPHIHNFGGNKAFMPNLFETLTVIDANGRLAPNLATAWTLVDDTTWDITLRPDVAFSDGAPLTADDVAFTLHRVATLPTTAANFSEYVKDIARVEVTGPHQLRLFTHGPFPLLPEYMASVGIVSRAHGENAGTTDYNSGPAAIGTGPYRLVSWARGDRLVMQPNEHYWGPKPAWNTVTFRYVKNASSRLAALLAGDADLIDTVSVQDINRLRDDRHFTVVSGLSADIVGFVFDKREQPSPKITGNDGQPLAVNPFHDPRVREAVDLAIDRDAIRDRVMNGQSAPDNQLMRGQYGYDPNLPPVRYDLAEAKRLLTEAGYPNGFHLTMDCQNDRFVNDAAICQAIAQMLTHAGIATTPEVMPHAVWVPRANKKEFSFFTTFWTFDTPEPSIVLISQFETADASRGRGAFNRGGYANPAFNSILETALKTMDRGQREKLLIQATDIEVRDHATVPLHHQFNIEAMTTHVHHTPRTDGHVLAADITPAE